MSGRDELSGSPEPNERQQMNRVGLDQNSLRSSSISEVFYEEDEVKNLPPASDVSNHTMSEEKEIIERDNLWLNDESTEKVQGLIELGREDHDLEADMSTKLSNVERKFNECSTSLQWNKERVRELEIKLTLREEVCSIYCSNVNHL